jgi:hypothetical protein
MTCFTLVNMFVLSLIRILFVFGTICIICASSVLYLCAVMSISDLIPAQLSRDRCVRFPTFFGGAIVAVGECYALPVLNGEVGGDGWIRIRRRRCCMCSDVCRRVCSGCRNNGVKLYFCGTVCQALAWRSGHKWFCQGGNFRCTHYLVDAVITQRVIDEDDVHDNEPEMERAG